MVEEVAVLSELGGGVFEGACVVGAVVGLHLDTLKLYSSVLAALNVFVLILKGLLNQKKRRFSAVHKSLDIFS